MSRVCTICTHPEREAIDRALIAGDAFRHIAARFDTSTSALQRHKADHLPARMVKATEAAETVSADSLLARLRALNAETADVLREAKKSADHELRLKAIQRAERQIELEGRLLGELQEGVIVNVAVMPEWLAMRAAILAALQPHPEARIAVAERLAALDTGRE